ncbi:MAG: hypothetical protein JWR74_875 [Polaromonas sp.]|jgi:hypothetical protein|nr:hypothetical protein [Polaromonas sp.]
MKVLSLRCSRLHSFEGWFGSEDDYQDQSTRGLLQCPLCADSSIQKMPSAPRLNLGGHPLPPAGSGPRGPDASSNVAPSGAVGSALTRPEPAEGSGMPTPGPAAQAALLNALRQVVAATQDMGDQFAEEARRMHYGEVETRGIRGRASAREAVELLEEGIEVIPLPMLESLKQTLQ